MSDIAGAGLMAECLRIEKMNGMLPASDENKVRERVVDKRESKLEGDSRMVLMVPAELRERLAVLKSLGFITTMTKVAKAGAEDEANRRLKARGEL